MSEAYDSADTIEAFEFESESESESESEAAWRPPSRPSGRGLYAPRPTGNAVSQVQLQAAMSRVGDQLRRASGAITTVNSRVNTVRKAEKRDNDERKKDFRSINEKIQLLALLPLLVKPSAVATQPGTVLDSAGNPISQVLVPDPSTLNAILPLLLMSGMGGSGGIGLGGGGESGSDSSMLMLAMVLAFAK